MDDRLVDAYAKLARAKFHIDDLAAKIFEAGYGKPYKIPLVRELDDDTGMLHFRVAPASFDGQEWGLIAGDAMHNLRSALDGAWWALALIHLGREPTEKEAGQIQFPIIRPGGRFNAGSEAHWVGPEMARFAEELQPSYQGNDSPPNLRHFEALAELRRLSNVDKHRKINLAVYVQGAVQTLISSPPEKFRPGPVPGLIFPGVEAGPFSPEVGDTLLSVPPDAWIRQPDFEFEALQAGFMSFDGRLDIEFVLGQIHAFVAQFLPALELHLEGHSVGLISEERQKVPDPMTLPPGTEDFVISPDGESAEPA